MEQRNSLKPSRRGHRCDSCVKKHLKCDRVLPKCLNCIKRKIECTLNREVVYNKSEDTEYGAGHLGIRRNYRPFAKDKFRFKVVNVSFTSKKEAVNTPKMLQLEESKTQVVKLEKKNRNQLLKSSKETKHQLSKLPRDYNFPYDIIGIFSKFKRKSLLENLLNFIQNPSPYFPSKGLNLFIVLTDKLGLLASKPKRLVFIPEVPNENTFNIRPILKQAVTNYFTSINKTLPLFDEIRFNFTSRSFNLKSAIFTGGLFYMEQTEIVKKLINYFEAKLYHFVSNVPRIKPCLENIQIILILTIGIPCFPWIGGIRDYLLFHCYRMSFIIGLSQSPKKLSKVVNIERIYTYCILNSFYNGILLSFGSYIAEPVFPLGLKKLNRHFRSKLSFFNIGFNEDDINIQRYCFLKLQEFYYITSTLYFDLRLIKEKKVKGSDDQVKLNSFLSRLTFKTFAVKEEYITAMTEFLPFINSYDLKSTIEDYQNCIVYFFHHINFYISSINFDVSEEKKVYEYKEHKLDKNISINILNRIKDMLKQCYLVIDSAAVNYHRYTLTLDYPLISTCLVFIIRYGGNNDELLKYIKKGKGLLESSLKLPFALKVCGLNLKLIEIITESLSNNMKSIKP